MTHAQTLTPAALRAAVQAAAQAAVPEDALVALVPDWLSPATHAALQRAPQVPSAAATLIEARAQMEAVAADTFDPDLLDALEALDAALDADGRPAAIEVAAWLAAGGPATLALQAALADAPLPPDRWWSRPFTARSQAVARGLAGATLGPAATPAEGTTAPPPEGAVRLAASALGPQPADAMARARVPVLLVDQATGSGLVGHLEVLCFDHPVPPFDHRLARHAERSLRAAYAGAGALTATGTPPLAFERHHFAVHLPAQPDGRAQGAVIDGPSLGLAALVGLVSAWQGRPVPADLAVSAALALGPTGAVRVQAVDGVPAKARAWAAAGGRRLALHPDNLAGPLVTDPALITVPVAPPEAAGIGHLLAAAGLAPQGIQPLDDDLTQHARSEALRRLSAQVRTQAVHDPSLPVRPGESPYQVLADRLQHHLLRLGDALPADARARHAADAIVAYGLAGDRDGVAATLRLIEPLAAERDALPPSARVELNIARLTQAIEQHVTEPCHPTGPDDAARQALLTQAEALTGALATVDPWGAAPLAGRVASTVGRVHLHLGDPYAAMPAFARAAEAFAPAHQRHELARCGVYQAMALRAAGALESAGAQLDAARDALEAWTRPFSEPYARECLLYWRYERGRLALAAGDGAGAARWLERALEDARWHGFWPTAGILRSLALANPSGDAAARLAALPTPQRLGRFHAALQAEAAGQWPGDPLVY